MEWLQELFKKYPELAVYLALGAGYWVGGRKIRGFSLGGATGSLLAGIVIGTFFKVPVAAMAKSVVFLLFMFGIGYSVGPKFFKAMKGEGWRYAVIGIVVPVVGLGTAYVVARILHLDLGFGAGLLSGGLTESPAIGTASEAIGWLRSIRPIFGQVPDGAVAFMQSLGLSGFVAMIGLGAGPEFIPAVKEAGVGLLIGGVFVTLVPQIAALYFGRYVLKANPILLLGALAGAQTFTPGLAAVQEKSGSPIAVLGYTGAVPLGHVLLTTSGTIIVLMLSHAT